MNTPVKYEEAAEQVRIIKADGSEIVGWMPVGRSNVVWLEEHQARYSAATDFPCKCGKRVEKGWTMCGECRHKLDVERFDKAYANAQPWDGKAPICEYEGDRFFWDADDLAGYMDARIEAGDSFEDVRLVFCKPDDGPHFEMSEYLCDSLPEDKELDDAGINKTVNDWIAANAPFCWWPDNSRPVLRESIKDLWREREKASDA